MIKKAISLGVSKINVNTECQLSFADATRKYIEAGKDLQGKGYDPAQAAGPRRRGHQGHRAREDRTVRLCQQGLILLIPTL